MQTTTERAGDTNALNGALIGCIYIYDEHEPEFYHRENDWSQNIRN